MRGCMNSVCVFYLPNPAPKVRSIVAGIDPLYQSMRIVGSSWVAISRVKVSWTNGVRKSRTDLSNLNIKNDSGWSKPLRMNQLLTSVRTHLLSKSKQTDFKGWRDQYLSCHANGIWTERAWTTSRLTSSRRRVHHLCHFQSKVVSLKSYLHNYMSQKHMQVACPKIRSFINGFFPAAAARSVETQL